MMRISQNPPLPPNHLRHQKRNGLWWGMMFSLLVWNIVAFWPKQHSAVSLPYTTILAQIRADHVAKIHIEGDRMNGTFKQPLSWPPAAQKQAHFLSEPAPSTYQAFNSIFPEAVGDPTLLPLLESHGVEVTAATPATPWLMTLLIDGFPTLMLIAFFVWIGRQSSKSRSGLFGFGRSQARRYTPEGPLVTFDDVAGADEAKAELQEEVDFLREPRKYHNLGARIPRGVLLVGPPGTGKTLLARTVAGEAEVPFFSLSASEFVEMFVGVGASRVRDLFVQAKAAAPAIVFIDELDAVGRRRGAGIGTGNDEREQTLNQLLVEMDGFDDRQAVIVLAATNRPDVLDPALLRPGRFDRQVLVPLPDRVGRQGILQIHTCPLKLASDVDLALVAQSSTGMSGAELANLCNEAALIAARHNHLQVCRTDFDEALDKMVLGQKRPKLVDPHERRIVATHEAGHTLVAWLTPQADPVHKVTIVGHGRALGATEQLPVEDRYHYSHTYLMARLAVMLGGRVAEEVVFGDVTTGAESDLIDATWLAQRMVARWGMGTLGLAAFDEEEQQPWLGYSLSHPCSYSETTATRIDQDIQQVLEERSKKVEGLLTQSRDRLDRLTQALLDHETLDQQALTQLLGPRPSLPALESNRFASSPVIHG